MFERLRNISTLTKILGMGVVIIALFGLGTNLVLMPRIQERLLEEKRQALRSSVEMACNVLASFQERAAKGEMSLEAAKDQAKGMLRVMRYAGDNYVWINDTQTPHPVMLMHPTAPTLEGARLSSGQYNTATMLRFGKSGDTRAVDRQNLFTAAVEVVSRSGEGYVSYVWPKPVPGGVTSATFPKESFVRLFAPWGWVVGTGIYIDDVGEEMARLTRFGLMVSGLASLLALGLAFVSARSISRPIGRLLDYTVRVGQGSSDCLGAEGFHGEMRPLRDGLCAMVARLSEMIDEARRLKRTADEETLRAKDAVALAEQRGLEAVEGRRLGILSAASRIEDAVAVIESASEELRGEIDRVAAEADQEAGRIAESVRTMEEMAAELSAMNHNADRAGGTVEQAKAKALAGRDSVDRVISGIGQVQDRAQGLKTDMNRLGERAQGIGHVLGVISDIADQTNLLALNAAIEAARAGDAGRGFAVVADEVRKLAEKTMTATREVEEAVQGIQQSAQATIGNVEQAVTGISEATALAGESGTSLAQIVALVEEAAGQVGHIARASHAQLESGRRVSLALGEVDQGAADTCQVMHEAAGSVARMADQARRLRELVDSMRNEGEDAGPAQAGRGLKALS